MALGWGGRAKMIFSDWRLTTLTIATMGAISIVGALALALSTIRVDMQSFSAAAIVLPIISLWLILAALRYQLGKSPFRYREHLNELATRIQALVVTLGIVTMFSTGLIILSYLASATSRPLMDKYLAEADAAIGFDWIAVVAWLNQSPLAATVLGPAYNSLQYQVLLVLGVLAFTRANRLLEFAAAFGLTGGLTCAIMAAVPASGAVDFYHPPAQVTNSFTVGASAGHLDQLYALRTMEPFAITNPTGLVTFPSFHTALALLFMYYIRGVRYAAPPIHILNILLIVSTVPVGGHYIVDVLAGGMLAATSIQTVRWIAGQRPLRGDFRNMSEQQL